MFSFYDFKIKSEKEVKDCDPKNEYRSFECIQKYLASKAKCRFPWLKKYYNSQKSLKSCNTTEESKALSVSVNLAGVHRYMESICWYAECHSNTLWNQGGNADYFVPFQIMSIWKGIF